jgi:hypothetical protein
MSIYAIFNVGQGCVDGRERHTALRDFLAGALTPLAQPTHVVTATVLLRNMNLDAYDARLAWCTGAQAQWIGHYVGSTSKSVIRHTGRS